MLGILVPSEPCFATALVSMAAMATSTLLPVWPRRCCMATQDVRNPDRCPAQALIGTMLLAAGTSVVGLGSGLPPAGCHGLG